MHRLFAAAFIAAALAAQTPPTSAPTADTQVTQALLTEIRALRQDLQLTAATIQRVQILMYRLQIETTMLNAATQRREQIKNTCGYTFQRRKMLTSQIEQAEARQRSMQTPPDPKAPDVLSQLKMQLEMLSTEEQTCQTRQIDADNEYRAQEMKVSDLQGRFDQLDKVLANVGGK
jgi:hypothetical protein